MTSSDKRDTALRRIHVFMYNYLNTDAVSSPPTGWLFKKPSDNHDTFLDADSNMNLFELTDQVQILFYIIVDLKAKTIYVINY